MNAYWRAANYLSVGQIYLKDNPLLRRPLTLDDVKPRLLGHWGTTPGLNFLYVHWNRIIRQRDLNMIFVIGPGHGGPGIVANTYLEGSYTEIYPPIEQNSDGIKRLFRQFSWPYGIPSHVAPETPGSIHEGGELGYSLVHAYGAAFDNPDLIVACVVGDGEAETGPLATSWHSNKFLNPVTDGAVLPILHLNGYKIANPTILARIPHAELEELMRGYGYEPFTLEGDDPAVMHQKAAAIFDTIFDRIAAIQTAARIEGSTDLPRWPMLIMRTPKGWTGPKFVDGKPVENTWRAHQVPFSELREKPEHLKLLEDWMRSYKPEELFDERGAFRDELAAIAPKGRRRMGMNPHANGGLLLQPLRVPNFRDYAVAIEGRGQTQAESTRVLGRLLRGVMEANLEHHNFRVVGPDETASNRLDDVIKPTGKTWLEATLPVDENLSPTGRVMEILSEHMCQGWLEGYLLTGRHGFFSCYEAFIHIVDSMVNQHAKWLKVTRGIPWRKPIASLNYLLSSLVWRQDHNGFSHQDPGFIDHLLNKKADVVRIYLPPDANTLLSVSDHCLRSRNYINLIVAGKQPAPQWLTDRRSHCPLHDRSGRVEVGLRRGRSRCGDGVLRRCADHGSAGRRDAAARAGSRHSHSRGQRGGPDGSTATVGASSRAGRRGIRSCLYEKQAGDLRVPRVSVCDSPAHIPASQSRQHSRPRLQGRRHYDDAVRHVRAQQYRSLPTHFGRDYARTAAGVAG